MKHTQLSELGWCRFAHSAALARWAESVQPVATQLLGDPAQAHWWRHGNTWFAGVNSVPNDSSGSVAGGPALGADVCQWVREQVGLSEALALQWEPGQLSVLRPGYPQQAAGESEVAHRYRCRRDAAHVDGLLPVGEARQRMPQEFHRFILGIPLHHTPAHAGPTVVWEGSHRLMQRAFARALRPIDRQDWPQTDLTEIYQSTRREVFARCKRVELHLPPGECYLIHRFALHGVAPWPVRAGEQAMLRSVVFFRPELGSRWDWLVAP